MNKCRLVEGDKDSRRGRGLENFTRETGEEHDDDDDDELNRKSC